jgi:hypothetical protein
MAMEEWFVGRNGRRVGPHRLETLRAGAAKGKLRPDDLVWHEGMANWSRADTVADLIDAFPKSAAAPTTAVAKDEHLTGAAPGAQPERASTSNYILRHWRGALSLPVSYWINYFFVGVVCAIAVSALSAGGMAESMSMRAAGLYTLLLMMAVSLVSIWSVVGVWRSADHHAKRGGTRGWAQVAKVVACIGLIRLMLTLIGHAPIAVESFKLATGHDTTAASRLRVLNRATEVEVSGGLSFGTADSLKTVLDATPTVKLIQLNNSGGWIPEGERLAKLVRERHLATYTARECDSACLLVFLAGTNRFLGANAHLGFHQASVAGITGEVAEKGNEAFREALTSRGVPADFIEHALSTPASSMWYPTSEELKRAHLITAVVDEGTFGQTGIAGWQDPERIEHDILAVPVFAALAKAEPIAFQEFKEGYIADIQAGIPQQEANARLRALLMTKIMPLYLRSGNDAPLIAYWRTQVREMRELRARDPNSCIRFVYSTENQPSATSLLSPATLQADLNNLIQLLLAGKGEATAPSEKAVAPSLKTAGVRAEREMSGALELVANGSVKTTTPGPTCDALAAFYSAILSLPPEEAGPVLKYIASQP